MAGKSSSVRTTPLISPGCVLEFLFAPRDDIAQKTSSTRTALLSMRTPRPVRIVNPPTNENVWDEVDNSWISKIHAWRIALDRRLCNAVEGERGFGLKLKPGDLQIMGWKSLFTLL